MMIKFKVQRESDEINLKRFKNNNRATYLGVYFMKLNLDNSLLILLLNFGHFL